MYAPELRHRETSRMQMEQVICQSLDSGMLELYYQPQIDAEGHLAGMEALVRIRHPQHGLILPDAFIGIAENAGLIAEIDMWVLGEACRQYAFWQSEGYKPVRIAVNMSRTSLANATLAQKICGTIARAGLDTSSIQIELTESTMLEEGEVPRETLRRLKQAGISLALDDFGTGYSSLSCLHRLPVDTVKIDKSFIQHLQEDAHSLPFVEAIIGVAKTLGLLIVAEGIETEDQSSTMRRLGCDFLQGFHISPPLQVTEIFEHRAVQVKGAASRLCLVDNSAPSWKRRIAG
jgi:EAL domain-containing protein (putative c-di-GMP-specific phosphodiesterase class I)